MQEGATLFLFLKLITGALIGATLFLIVVQVMRKKELLQDKKQLIGIALIIIVLMLGLVNL